MNIELLKAKTNLHKQLRKLIEKGIDLTEEENTLWTTLNKDRDVIRFLNDLNLLIINYLQVIKLKANV